MPIPYSSLHDYFKADPAISWGGYVAGCLLVLARERGVTFPDGISMLICSDVPEGARGARLCIGRAGQVAAAHKACTLASRAAALRAATAGRDHARPARPRAQARACRRRRRSRCR